MILALCERFHCLPSQLYQEDVSLLALLAIAAEGQSTG